MSMIPPSVGLRTFPPSGLGKTELASPRTIAEACDLLARGGARGRSGGDPCRGNGLDRGPPYDAGREGHAARPRDRRDSNRRALGHLFPGDRGGAVAYARRRRDLLGAPRDDARAGDDPDARCDGNGRGRRPDPDARDARREHRRRPRCRRGGTAFPRSWRWGSSCSRARTGERRIALDAFFTGYRKTVMRPDELIAAIDVRIPRPGALVTWRKVGTRLAQSISKVALAAAIEVDAAKVVRRARFGMASVAAVTSPLAKACACVEGRRSRRRRPRGDRRRAGRGRHADRRRAQHGGVSRARGADARVARAAPVAVARS